MAGQLLRVEIVKVQSPSHIVAVMMLPGEEKKFIQSQLQWQKDMDDILRHTILNHSIEAGQICAVDVAGVWQRARVEQYLYTSFGEKARCFCVDTGQELIYPLHKLYSLPDRYHSDMVPYRTKTMRLWRLLPLSLKLEISDSGLCLPYRSSQVWDDSATNVIQKMVSESVAMMVCIMSPPSAAAASGGGDGVFDVCLYQCIGGVITNINKLMVAEKYACDEDKIESNSIDLFTPIQRNQLFIAISSNDSKSEQVCCALTHCDVVSVVDCDSECVDDTSQCELASFERDDGKEIAATVQPGSFRPSIHHSSSTDSFGSDVDRQPNTLVSSDVVRNTAPLPAAFCLTNYSWQTSDKPVFTIPACLPVIVPSFSVASSASTPHLVGTPHEIPHCSISSCGIDYLGRKVLVSSLLPSSWRRVHRSRPRRQPVEIPAGNVDEAKTPGTFPQQTLVPTVMSLNMPETSLLKKSLDMPDVVFSGILCSEDAQESRHLTAMEKPHSPAPVQLEESVGVYGSDLSGYQIVPCVSQNATSDMQVKFCPTNCSPHSYVAPSSVVNSVTGHAPLNGIIQADEPSIVTDRAYHGDGQDTSGCIAGDSSGFRFFKNLMSGKAASGLVKSTVSSSTPQVWRSDMPKPNPLLGTIVFGAKHCPPAVYNIDDVPFHTVVIAYLRKEGMKMPRSAQANIWPAVLRGCDVIGIGPPASGMTTAYLPALISRLLSFSNYQHLPKGGGPKAIILAASSVDVDAIYTYTTGIVATATTLKVQKIYGCNDYQMIPLLRGCDLLIATPMCLLRMLSACYTNTDRLCHLVLDKADVILDRFSEEVEELMSFVRKSDDKHIGLCLQRQNVLVGCTWTSAVAEFQISHQLDPVLVFASRLEAAVYGRIKQEVHQCYEDQRLTVLGDLLSSLLSCSQGHCRIVVVTSMDHTAVHWRNNDCHTISDVVRGLTVPAYVVDIDDSVTLDAIPNLVAKWSMHQSASLIVVPDHLISQLRITNADIVIHFDLPNSKTKFGNRLALMLDHFCGERQVSDDDNNSSTCEVSESAGVRVTAMSHCLVTDRTMMYMESLYSFLLRSNSVIPPTMMACLDLIRKARNKDTGRRLCLALKQFGLCHDERHCQQRHLVLDCDLVSDQEGQRLWPPADGIVKIRILRVLDANRLFALLLEHRQPGAVESEDLQHLQIALRMDMAMYLAKPDNRLPYSLLTDSHALAALQNEADDLFYRVKMVGTVLEKLNSTRVEVFYVDEGWSSSVRCDQLLRLPEHLQIVPPLAVEAIVCRIKPVDRDETWASRCTDYVRNFVKGKDLYGTVILRLSGTVWLDPLAEQVTLTSIKLKVVSTTMRSTLLSQALADDNPQHISNLFALCEEKMHIPRMLYEKYLHIPKQRLMELEHLPDSVSLHQVRLVAGADPDDLYVMLCDKQERLDELEKKISEVMLKVVKLSSMSNDGGSGGDRVSHLSSVLDVPSEQDRVELDIGGLCAAKSDWTNRWHRGKLVRTTDKGWLVFFIDHGDEQEVDDDNNVLPLPDEFCALPAQAIHCSLAGIRPIGDLWDSGCIDLLWDLANTVDGQKKVLVAKVAGVCDDGVTGSIKYSLKLMDNMSWSCEKCFSQELLWSFLARPANNDCIEMPFPERRFSLRRRYASIEAQLGDYLAILFWEMSEDRALFLAEQVAELLPSCLESNLEQASTLALLTGVVRLIGYIRFTGVFTLLAGTLHRCLLAQPLECGSLVGVELVEKLAFCMEQMCQPHVQIIASEFASLLVNVEEFMKYMRHERLINIMFSMIQVPSLDEVIMRNVSNFLTCLLVSGCELCLSQMEASETIETLVDLLSAQSVLDSQTADIVQLMAAGAGWCSSEANLTELIAECDNLLAGSSDQDPLPVETGQRLAPYACRMRLHSRFLREKSIRCILHVIKDRIDERCLFHCARLCLALLHGHPRNKRTLFDAGLYLLVKRKLELELSRDTRRLYQELGKSLFAFLPSHETVNGVPYRGSSSSKPVMLTWSQTGLIVNVTVSVDGANGADFDILPTQISYRSASSQGTSADFTYLLYASVDVEKCSVHVKPSTVLFKLVKRDKGIWKRLLHQRDKLFNVKCDFENTVDSSSSETESQEPPPPAVEPLEDNPSVCLCSSESSSEDNLEDVADSGDETYDDHIDLEPSMYVDLVCRNIDFADR